jgi:hypothetical protein
VDRGAYPLENSTPADLEVRYLVANAVAFVGMGAAKTAAGPAPVRSHRGIRAALFSAARAVTVGPAPWETAAPQL